MAAQPIIKLLTFAGAGSRRQITAKIKSGLVTVNGTVIESFNELVDPAKDIITIDGKRFLVKVEPRIYLLLNKPAGVTSSVRSERGEKTVMDILPEKYSKVRLYPVGRLDKDSTGLILLTNDGDFTLKLTHPSFEKEKEYIVKIEADLKPADVKALETGINLTDGRTSPAKVAKLRQAPFAYSVIIHEGKKRQIRRMFASLGYRVRELKRVRMGSLWLGTLPEGKTRELTTEEIKNLQKA